MRVELLTLQQQQRHRVRHASRFSIGLTATFWSSDEGNPQIHHGFGRAQRGGGQAADVASKRDRRDAECRDGVIVKHLLLVIFLVWIAIYLTRRKRR
jgi:hypothetical protein